MKHGSTRSMIFTPPAVAVRDQLDADRSQAEVVAVADPQQAVLIYGHMLTDCDIVYAELRGLLFSGADYRSRLRVVRSAAKRLEDRAARLLGEAS